MIFQKLSKALDPCGVQFEALDRNAALVVIFSKSRVSQRWLKGEQVFSAALADKAMTNVRPENVSPASSKPVGR